MRELLDPTRDQGIALPPHPGLLEELTSPKWSMQGDRVYVQSREEIVADIGRSPDIATAYVLAAIDVPKAASVGHAGVVRPLEYDPYAAFRGQ